MPRERTRNAEYAVQKTPATQQAQTQAPSTKSLQMKSALRDRSFDEQVQMLAPGGKGDQGQVHAQAAAGMASGGGRLPHMDAIQKSFGRHDVSKVQAHQGSAASAATAAMGANAYASGNDVVLGDKGGDLHTVAHEAAHVVQQRAGVQLSGGVGKSGDAYEQHADKVADQVVQGKSAEGLLDTMAGGGAGGAVQQSAVQQSVVQRKYGDTTPEKEPSKSEPPKNEPPKEVPKTEGLKTENVPKTEGSKSENVPKTEGLKTEDPKTEKPQTEGPRIEFVKNLSTNTAPVYHVKVDGKDMVVKYQGPRQTLDDYLLGRCATEIGFKYPLDQISIHMEGSKEEQQFTKGLKSQNKTVSGCVTVMPLFAFKENQVAMSATMFTNLGKCFAYDIFIYGSDRFKIQTTTKSLANLFMQGDDPLMIDTASAHSMYTNRETHKESMRFKLKHESRKDAFNLLFAKAKESSGDQTFSKKVRAEMKAAFHSGIATGMNEIFAKKDQILEHAKEVDKLDENKNSRVLGHGLDNMLEDLRTVLKEKKSMHSEGKVYRFLVD